VQISMVSRLQKNYGQVKDLGVKQAPFVVLVGAEMPSTLIEVSFISNYKEEKLLQDQLYLDALADAIVDGLKKYAQDTKIIGSYPSSISDATSLNSN
jgi:N-acetylmuramoyl-L-alanine amidase